MPDTMHSRKLFDFRSTAVQVYFIGASIAYLAVFSLSPLAQTSPQPPVHLCDQLTGDPRDPDRVVRGVRVPEIDTEKALPACREAVSSFPNAARFEYHLGRTYHGMQDYYSAAIWYRRAAENGYPPAMSILGVLHTSGEGVARDYEQAALWYRRAADKGNFVAMFNLGVRYADGRGVDQDIDHAITWLKRSAAKGHGGAMEGLGFIFLRGRGVDEDRATAVQRFAKAAAKGRPEAMYHLAWAYDTGRGIDSDGENSAYWFVRSVQAKHQNAYKDLVANNDKLQHSTRLEIQKLLRSRSYFAGVIDGAFGPDTIRAIKMLAQN